MGLEEDFFYLFTIYLSREVVFILLEATTRLPNAVN
jgi:hypothetical protein